MPVKTINPQQVGRISNLKKLSRDRELRSKQSLNGLTPAEASKIDLNLKTNKGVSLLKGV